MHGRVLHDASAGDDRFPFSLPNVDKPGAGADPNLVVDQRLVLHQRRFHRVRDVRVGSRLPTVTTARVRHGHGQGDRGLGGCGLGDAHGGGGGSGSLRSYVQTVCALAWAAA